jgi:sulfate transporter 4
MSYAVLAGLPPVYGLYGAFVPVLVYALFGSSKHLAVGPVAVTSLLLGTAIHRMYPESKDIEDAADPPPELADVQAQINTTVIQVGILG